VESREDVTALRLPRYKAIQDGVLRVKTPLFVILERAARRHYLYYQGDRQVTPLRTDDFHGKEIPCPGFGRRAAIVGVVPAGTLLRIAQVLEGRHLEAGPFSEVLARLDDSTNGLLYHIEFLLAPSGQSHVFSQQTLLPKDDYLEIVEETMQ
jgi:hypothetical protein